jgi:hypothetical protein
VISPPLAGFQLLRNQHARADLPEKVDDPSAQHGPRLSERPARLSRFGERLDELVTPEKLGHCHWVERGIAFGAAHAIEVHASAFALPNQQHAPPAGYSVERGAQVPVRDDQRHPVENRVEADGLGRQTTERVGRSFDLVAF